MAQVPLSSLRISIRCFSLLLLLAAVASDLSAMAAVYEIRGHRGWGRKVGGWTVIPDAQSNKEVRNLGRFSVEEYNRGLRSAGDPPLAFSGVLSAIRQVVSGIKYRIRIAAVDSRTGDRRCFEAVVVVRLWLKDRGRDLLSFTPANG
ncbi:Cysteine proteinase inhibitor 10 [Apostasia shenzhenica]|uniref:Cysteine proteinase inhibitor 10 n=1 Tax=Apostasia shenzhenica TaxID=1088818 RepID=A0A2I0AH97_9ASPA|nr:Cysteine proteinase inhibitor 10 [Apostasia shenzhenica]